MLLNPFRFAAFSTLWNPLDKGASMALSLGNTKATGAAVTQNWVRGGTPKSSGKWYVEFITNGDTNNNDLCIGIGNAAADLSTGIAAGRPGSYAYMSPASIIYSNTGTGGTVQAARYSTENMGVGMDFTSNTLNWYKNGVLVRNWAMTADTYFILFTAQNTKFATIQTAPLFVPSGYLPW